MEKPVNPLETVEGAERLVEIFGAWPSFHDAEILELRLDRMGRGEFEGPTLDIRFHLYEGRQDASLPIRVSIQQAFGLGGSLLCGSVEVAAVEAGCPPRSVYAEE